MKRIIRMTGLLILALGLAPSAKALPIATWDLANATGQQADVLSTATNVTASVLDEVGVTEWSSTAQDGFIASQGWAASATTYDPTRYYEFSVTADVGFSVTYESIDLALFRGINGGGHGAEKWDLRASTDVFVTSDIGLGTFDISTSGIDEQIQFVGHDITAVGAQSGTVTFRLYGYDYTSSGDYSGLGNDDGTWAIVGTGLNPTVHGTSGVSTGSGVPEPAGFALALSGLCGLFLVGRVSAGRRG